MSWRCLYGVLYVCLDFIWFFSFFLYDTEAEGLIPQRGIFPGYILLGSFSYRFNHAQHGGTTPQRNLELHYLSHNLQLIDGFIFSCLFLFYQLCALGAQGLFLYMRYALHQRRWYLFYFINYAPYGAKAFIYLFILLFYMRLRRSREFFRQPNGLGGASPHGYHVYLYLIYLS